jgi:Uma2 family endonuclease
MAEPILATPHPLVQPVDRDLFSLHPEEHMTERPSHRRQGTYAEFAFRRLLPDWFVAGNMGVYWVPGEFEYPYVGPDVLVARTAPAREDAAVFLTYEDGPVTLVVEIASPSTRNMDRKKRDNDYALELAVPWYLWIDLPRQVLELHRLIDGRYELMTPDEHGRVWCTDLSVGFAWDATERLVRVLAPGGTIVLTPDEEAGLRDEETALRQAAEARAEAAEQTAAAERERAAALATELDRLRQALKEAGGADADQS